MTGSTPVQATKLTLDLNTITIYYARMTDLHDKHTKEWIWASKDERIIEDREALLVTTKMIHHENIESDVKWEKTMENAADFLEDAWDMFTDVILPVSFVCVIVIAVFTFIALVTGWGFAPDTGVGQGTIDGMNCAIIEIQDGECNV